MGHPASIKVSWRAAQRCCMHASTAVGAYGFNTKVDVDVGAGVGADVDADVSVHEKNSPVVPC